jgi:hypothetical protein
MCDSECKCNNENELNDKIDNLERFKEEAIRSAKAIEDNFKSIENNTEGTKQILTMFSKQLENISGNINALSETVSNIQLLISAMAGCLEQKQLIFTKDIVSSFDDLKVAKWNEQSLQEDIENNLEPIEKIESVNDIIILTSTCSERPELSNFRLKVLVSSLEDKELQKVLIGKSVSDVIIHKIGENTHTIHILGIRKKTK